MHVAYSGTDGNTGRWYRGRARSTDCSQPGERGQATTGRAGTGAGPLRSRPRASPV
nr:hypothetical protein [Mesorhizobium sp.]